MEEEILPSLLTSFSSTKAYAPLLLRSTQFNREFQQHLIGKCKGKKKILDRDAELFAE